MESNGYYSVNTLVHKFPNHTLRDRHVLQGNDARLSLVWVEVVWQNNNIQPVEFLAFDMASVKGSGNTEAADFSLICAKADFPDFRGRR